MEICRCVHDSRVMCEICVRIRPCSDAEAGVLQVLSEKPAGFGTASRRESQSNEAGQTARLELRENLVEEMAR